MSEIEAALKWADEVWEHGKKPIAFGDVGLSMSERSHIHTLAFEYQHLCAQVVQQGLEEDGNQGESFYG
jgi:hypothetical protein